jgi:hypothetical protein
VQLLWNALKIRKNKQEMSEVGKSAFKKKDSARRIFCTGKTSEIRRAESFCLQKPFLTVRLIFGALKSDYTRAWSKSVPEITVVLVNVV